MRRTGFSADHVTPPADPPRCLPLSLRLHLLLGGVGQAGWFFLGFGAVFVAIFVPGLDPGPIVFHGPREITWARVTRVEDSGYSQGRHRRASQHRGGTIYAYAFEFEDKASVTHQATSYGGHTNFQPGSRAQVEYLTRDPSVARIMGLRMGPVSLGAGFVILFPLVGVILLLYRLQKGIRALRLLRTGRTATARLLKREPLDRHINKRQVFRFTFEYQDSGGQTHTRVADTHEPRRLTDERDEWVLYDPWRPDRAFMLDELPVRIRTNERGELLPSGLGWVSLAIPAIAVATCAGLALAFA